MGDLPHPPFRCIWLVMLLHRCIQPCRFVHLFVLVCVLGGWLVGLISKEETLGPPSLPLVLISKEETLIGPVVPLLDWRGVHFQGGN